MGLFDGDGGGDDATVGVDLRERAAELAETYPEADLDFTADSLARLDDLLTAEHGDLAAREDDPVVLAATALPYGAYFGEVLQRRHDAEWVAAGEGVAIAVPTPDGEAVGVDVVDVSTTCLSADRTFAAAYEDLLAAREGDGEES